MYSKTLSEWHSLILYLQRMRLNERVEAKVERQLK